MTETKKFLSKTREQLYEMYMDALKEDTIPWERPWDSSVDPINPTSNTKYRGVNRMILWLISSMRDIQDPRWATFNQIADTKGKYHPGEKWKLKEGTKGIPVEFWKMREVGTKNLIDLKEYEKIISQDPDARDNYRPYVRISYVFNYADIDGVPKLEVTNNKTVSIPLLEEFADECLKNMGVGIIHGSEQAFYRPVDDVIYMPDISRFHSAEDYYATRLHETAHSTGAEKRMNRELSGGFGSDSYAKEELRAEIASSIIYADLNMPTDVKTLDNHKAYIQSWIQSLEKDPNVLFSAIRDAELITDYVMKHAPIALEKIHNETKNLSIEVDLNAKEAAYQLEDNYLELHIAADGSWDYTIYDQNLSAVDGGQLGEEGKMKMDEAILGIIAMHGLSSSSITQIPIDEFEDLQLVASKSFSFGDGATF